MIQNNADTFSPEEKYFLVLLYAPDKKGKLASQVRGNLWLQKEIFLLSKNLDELKGLRFDEHLYGPYSPTIEAIEGQFENSNIISQPLDQGPIFLTKKGKDIAAKLWRISSEQIRRLVIGVKHMLNDLTPWEVISLIYSTYPETTRNSDILEQYSRRRLATAISLLKKKKVSIEKAAQISGKTLQEFLHVLEKRGISAFEVDMKEFEEDLKFIERIA